MVPGKKRTLRKTGSFITPLLKLQYVLNSRTDVLQRIRAGEFFSCKVGFALLGENCGNSRNVDYFSIVRSSLFTRKSNSHVTGLVRSRCIVGEEHGTND